MSCWRRRSCVVVFFGASLGVQINRTLSIGLSRLREGPQEMPRGTVVSIVSSDPEVCEAELLAGILKCPSCDGSLRPWGYARWRTIRMAEGTKKLRPRRSRCPDCYKTSVLLPNYLLVRRVDEAAVIGSALTQKAQGMGHRKVALNISRPATTVRGWIRRFGERSKMLLEHFLGWALALDVTLSEFVSVGSSFNDALCAIGIAVRSMSIRFGPSPKWSQMSAICGGMLLCNTNSPFPAPP
jgi:transposase-like protein